MFLMPISLRPPPPPLSRCLARASEAKVPGLKVTLVVVATSVRSVSGDLISKRLSDAAEVNVVHLHIPARTTLVQLRVGEVVEVSGAEPCGAHRCWWLVGIRVIPAAGRRAALWLVRVCTLLTVNQPQVEPPTLRSINQDCAAASNVSSNSASQILILQYYFFCYSLSKEPTFNVFLALEDLGSIMSIKMFNMKNYSFYLFIYEIIYDLCSYIK